MTYPFLSICALAVRITSQSNFVTDTSRRECARLEASSQEERARVHLLERDKDALTYNVRRLTSERSASSEERVALEEKLLNLEVLMADLKDECNTLRVKQAEQQAVIYQHDTEAARLRQLVDAKDDVIGKFKQLVQDNQNAAEKLRQECER